MKEYLVVAYASSTTTKNQAMASIDSDMKVVPCNDDVEEVAKIVDNFLNLGYRVYVFPKSSEIWECLDFLGGEIQMYSVGQDDGLPMMRPVEKKKEFEEIKNKVMEITYKRCREETSDV